MAADILIYKADAVPVGQDQTQHLELTRDIARRFNNAYGETFPEIEGIFTKAAKVMALNEPTKKMSKSIPGSYIGLTEDPDSIRKKIKRAVTASDADSDQMPPGVANLFMLLESFAPQEITDKFKQDYEQQTIRYSELKEAVGEYLVAGITPIRERYLALKQQPEQLRKILDRGAEQARTIAQENLQEIKRKVGLLY